jgi:hypothetical protein
MFSFDDRLFHTQRDDVLAAWIVVVVVAALAACFA